VNERRDDTTKPETESPRARRPGSYYYDDATGYEIYKPGEDEDEECLKEKGEAETKDERRASRMTGRRSPCTLSSRNSATNG
jgi:hypothetical protein